MKKVILLTLVLMTQACTTLYVNHVPGTIVKVNDNSSVSLSGFAKSQLVEIHLDKQQQLGTVVSWDSDSHQFIKTQYKIVLSVFDNRCYTSAYQRTVMGQPVAPYRLTRAAFYNDNGTSKIAILTPASGSEAYSLEQHVKSGILTKTTKDKDEKYHSHLDKQGLERYLKQTQHSGFRRLSTDEHDIVSRVYLTNDKYNGSGDALNKLHDYLKNCRW